MIPTVILPIVGNGISYEWGKYLWLMIVVFHYYVVVYFAQIWFAMKHLIQLNCLYLLKARGGGGGGVRASKNRKNYYSLNQFIYSFFDEGNFAGTHLFVAA